MAPRYCPFLFLYVFISLFPQTSAWSQRVTATERDTIKQVKSQIDSAAKLYKSKKYAESVAAVEAAAEKIVFLASGARPELLRAIKIEYERLAKTHRLLTEAGETPKPLLRLEEAASREADIISFQKSVAPILVSKCGDCHVRQTRGRFSAASFDALEKSTTIAYGIPQDSRLIQVGGTVEPAELEILRKWILQGAKFDGENRSQDLAQMVNAQNQPAPAPSVTQPTGKETVSFGLHIAPILLENCAQCHMVNNPRGNFSQVSFESLLRGGNTGPPIAPRNAMSSTLYQRIAAGEMPPAGKLPQSSIELIKTWIEEGAVFDGTNPRGTLVSVATTAKANAQSHTELMANRRELSLRQWQLVMGQADPKQIETSNYRVLGASNDNRLESVGDILEKMTPKLASYFKIKADSPWIKGNSSVFVFDKRYDFSEFGKMVSQRELSREHTSHWEFNVTDAFISVLLPPHETAADGEPWFAQQISAVYIASLANDVPRWFAEGVGYWAASKLLPSHDQISIWEASAAEALKSLKSPDDLLNNRLSEREAGLIGYRVVKALIKQRSTSFDRMIEKMRKGESFEAAFQSAYSATLPDFLRSGW
jgi:mono/diheme cytochrome c family protein